MPNWLAKKLPRATTKTAFFAGMWAGAVLVVYSYVETHVIAESSQNTGFMITAIVGLIPAFPFVFGDQPKHDGSFKERFIGDFRFVAVVMKRGIFWLLGAGVVGATSYWIAELIRTLN